MKKKHGARYNFNTYFVRLPERRRPNSIGLLIVPCTAFSNRFFFRWTAWPTLPGTHGTCVEGHSGPRSRTCKLRWTSPCKIFLCHMKHVSPIKKQYWIPLKRDVCFTVYRQKGNCHSNKSSQRLVGSPHSEHDWRIRWWKRQKGTYLAAYTPGPRSVLICLTCKAHEKRNLSKIFKGLAQSVAGYGIYKSLWSSHFRHTRHCPWPVQGWTWKRMV